jgi:hypothetical protein
MCVEFLSSSVSSVPWRQGRAQRRYRAGRFVANRRPAATDRARPDIDRGSAGAHHPRQMRAGAAARGAAPGPCCHCASCSAGPAVRRAAYGADSCARRFARSVSELTRYTRPQSAGRSLRPRRACTAHRPGQGTAIRNQPRICYPHGRSCAGTSARHRAGCPNRRHLRRLKAPPSEARPTGETRYE